MTSACAAPQRMVNPLLAGGYAARRHQTFRRCRPCLAAPTSVPVGIMWIPLNLRSVHRRCHLYYSTGEEKMQPYGRHFIKSPAPSSAGIFFQLFQEGEDLALIVEPVPAVGD